MRKGGWGKRFYLFSFSQSRRTREADNPAGGQKGRVGGRNFCPPASEMRRKFFCEVAAGALAEAERRGEFIGRGSHQKKFGFRPKGTAILRIFHFRKRLPRGFAARQARKARQSPILRGFATLRVAKRKRLDFGFGSSNQSFLENPESLRDFLWKR